MVHGVSWFLLSPSLSPFHQGLIDSFGEEGMQLEISQCRHDSMLKIVTSSLCWEITRGITRMGSQRALCNLAGAYLY